MVLFNTENQEALKCFLQLLDTIKSGFWNQPELLFPLKMDDLIFILMWQQLAGMLFAQGKVKEKQRKEFELWAFLLRKWWVWWEWPELGRFYREPIFRKFM